MAIALRRLCKYAKEKYEMVQLAGDGNMNNLVDWVHMLEDPETADFLHGSELIFTTGIGQADTSWFLDFVKRLVKNNASGLVMNIGPYIDSVPEEVRQYCIEVEFPLFTIPWKTRIVDITNDFCHRIIRAEENEVTLGGAFRNAIFFPNNASQFAPILEGKAYDLDGDFSVMTLHLEIVKQDDLLDIVKNVRMHLSKILLGYSERFSIFRQDHLMIVVMQNYKEVEVKNVMDRLDKVCHYGEKTHKLSAGYSSNSPGISSLPRSYKRAYEVMKMAIKHKELYISYENIGVLQILIEIEDIGVLDRYYANTLGILEIYDDKHQSDYFYILKCYLKNNNSVEKVAKETYVHRNTINYKIKKIKEILNMELNNEEVSKLLLAYNIKELL